VADSPLLTLAMLCGAVALAQWLAQHTWLRHAGAALVVIVVVAILANLGLMPTGSTDARPVPVYDAILGRVAPLAIFWLLLRVELRRVLTAGPTLLVLFLLGATGVVLGALLGHAIFGSAVIGPHAPALTGMYTATYIGGSVNFNALALHYGVVKDGGLYAGATAVDAGLTTVWMIATLSWPRLFRMRKPPPPIEVAPAASQVEIVDLALLLSLGLACVWGSDTITAWLLTRGIEVPSIIVVTTIALVLAQVPAVTRLRGTEWLGMFAVLLFLAVIGALCDIEALLELGRLGPVLAGLACTIITVHAVVVLGGGVLLRKDPLLAAIASQANIGGGTTALAIARSFGREDLVLPAILVGALGTALGTYAGFLVVGALQ
jgi:uncharacterized membrane protein